MKTLGVLAGLAVAILIAFVLWHLYLSPYTNRFRLTIEVETPGGTKSGSSVIETKSWESNWGPIEARGVRSQARGEAVFVDLGDGRHVIATLAFGPDGRDVDGIFGLTRAALAPGQRIGWKEGSRLRGKGELPVDQLPMLITFENINDPKTVGLVKPDEFDRSFGPGYRFLRAVVETTDDPVTRRIQERMPWLVGFKGVLGGDLRQPRDRTKPERYLAGNGLIRGAI